MSFPAVKVARDVCGDIIPTIAPYLDCSLCGLGWPQQSGEIMFNLYRGDACQGSDAGILGDYSYWLNGAYLPGRYQFQCRNPGPDAEPNPNEWIAGGEFSWGGTWRIDSILTVVDKVTVNLTGSIRWLNPATMKLEVWATFAKTMTEDNPQGITDPRRHRIFKSGKVAITPNAASGGIGDPVTHISFVLGTRPQIVGCGGELCALWDGTHYYSCFRAEVTDLGGIPALSQMGKAQQPCGGRDQYGGLQPQCDCDRIILRADGRHETYVNIDPAFIQEYGHLGNPPNDVEQQIQVGGPIVAKRWPGSPTRIWSKDQAGNYVEGTWTVSKDFGPTIWAVSFGSPVFRTARLFSLAFPNPGILPDACAPDPTPDDPSPYMWYCVDGTCIQWNSKPPNATGGPFQTLFACLGERCEPPPPKKWYCVNGVCGEYESAPVGATSGPHDTQADCEAGCQPPPANSKWYCVNGNCAQYESAPPGAVGSGSDTLESCQISCQAPATKDLWCCYGVVIQSTTRPVSGAQGPYSGEEIAAACPGPGEMVYHCTGSDPIWAFIGKCDAETLGVTYYNTQADAEAACRETQPSFWWCVGLSCVQSSVKPNDTATGPFNSQEECLAGCGTPVQPPAKPFWCVAGMMNLCVQADSAPANTVSGPYLSQIACFESCTVVVDPSPNRRIAPAPPPPETDQIQTRAIKPQGHQERFWLPCVHRGPEIPGSGFG